LLKHGDPLFRHKLIGAALRDDLQTGKYLVGIGLQSVVLKEGEMVLKKSTDAMGQPDEIMDYEATRIAKHDQLLRQAIGQMHVPATASLDTLRLRPFPTMSSVTISQDFIPHCFDVFHAPPSVVNSDVFQSDLSQLTKAIDDLVKENYHLDLLGCDNIVVETNTNHLKVVDTMMLPTYGLESVANDGLTQREMFNIKLTQLKSLRR
jgi:hypothetical protein